MLSFQIDFWCVSKTGLTFLHQKLVFDVWEHPFLDQLYKFAAKMENDIQQLSPTPLVTIS